MQDVSNECATTRIRCCDGLLEAIQPQSRCDFRVTTGLELRPSGPEDKVSIQDASETNDVMNAHCERRHHRFVADGAFTMPFRVETKQVYICTYDNCNKTYGRKPDLVRHYRGAHLGDDRYKCRMPTCERSMRGFPRRDKRDTHERKMHMRGL